MYCNRSVRIATACPRPCLSSACPLRWSLPCPPIPWSLVVLGMAVMDIVVLADPTALESLVHQGKSVSGQVLMEKGQYLHQPSVVAKQLQAARLIEHANGHQYIFVDKMVYVYLLCFPPCTQHYRADRRGCGGWK